MPGRSYPSDPAIAGLTLFQRWFGGYYARSARVTEQHAEGGVLRARLSVGRQWEVAVSVLDTLASEATPAFEAARAAIERRLDAEGRSVVLWVPRGAPLPDSEPGLSQVALAVASAKAVADGRLEVRRPVHLYLRRTSRTGSVVTILGGLSGQWAQFTNRVPGSFQLHSGELFRLPGSTEEREELAERIVLAAGQPGVDETEIVAAEDCWTANDLEQGGSYVIGSAAPDSDEQSAALRRELRNLLRRAAVSGGQEGAASALVVLGGATYAEEEKLSWALRGMDPSLFAGYDILTVVADGVVKPLLQPGRSTLPWDAPLA